MANPVVGKCACPLCREEGAEVRQGAKGALYIVCDECVSQVRTMSRKGRRCIESLSGGGLASPVVEKPAATAASSVVIEDGGAQEGVAQEGVARVPPKKAAGKWYETFGVSHGE